MLTQCLIAAACLTVLCLASFAQETELDTAPPYPVWPIPREADVAGKRLVLSDAAIVVPDGPERERFPGRLLSQIIADEFMVAIPVVAGRAPDGKTPILVGEVSNALISSAVAGKISPDDPGPDGYYVKVTDDSALIAGCDYRGTLYGVSTFVQLLHRWTKKSVAARQAVIRDWPFLPVRWVHVYIPGHEDIPFFKRYLRDFLLRYKFNGLILEVGAGMRLDSHPEINTGWARTVKEWYAYGESIQKFNEGIPLGPANRFLASCHFGVGGGNCIEKDELRDIAAFASGLGLEIIPEIQSLSHAYYIACARRDVAEEPDADWPDSYCPSNPESYKILFDVMDEYIDVLKPGRVHIGHDEYRSGAFCPRCKGKDSGKLYAEDVLRIHAHLKEKGIETWMWGDHFVDWHNRFGRGWSEGTVVRYEKPDTSAARDIVAAATKDIRIANWSGERGDETFKKLGWKFILGNFNGTRETDWPARVKRSGLLGAEVSSWCAADEFELAKLNIPQAAFSANLLWSTHYPENETAFEEIALLLPRVRAGLAARPPVSSQASPMRFETLDIRPAANSAPKAHDWDLSGVRAGEAYYNGLPYRIIAPSANGGKSCVLVSRMKSEIPMEVPLPITGRWASLVFIQSATGKGRDTIHAGDQTHFPRESSELLGFYEIRYADGLGAAHEIRCDETVAAWDAGFAAPLYFTRAISAGVLPDGRKAVLFASEWTNPRPDVPIVSVTMKGSPGPSSACPILFAVTAIEKPRVEDYR